jgi:hypothetical protein
MTVMNTSTIPSQALQSATLMQYSPGWAHTLGWLITVMIFATIIISLYLISLNVKRFVIGSAITTVLLVLYKFSRYISIQAITGNTGLLTKTIYAIIFIAVSTVIGMIATSKASKKQWNKWN